MTFTEKMNIFNTAWVSVTTGSTTKGGRQTHGVCCLDRECRHHAIISKTWPLNNGLCAPKQPVAYNYNSRGFVEIHGLLWRKYGDFTTARASVITGSTMGSTSVIDRIENVGIFKNEHTATTL